MIIILQLCGFVICFLEFAALRISNHERIILENLPIKYKQESDCRLARMNSEQSHTLSPVELLP